MLFGCSFCVVDCYVCQIFIESDKFAVLKGRPNQFYDVEATAKLLGVAAVQLAAGGQAIVGQQLGAAHTLKRHHMFHTARFITDYYTVPMEAVKKKANEMSCAVM